MNPIILQIANKVKDIGGRAYFVGGYVRDSILGIQSKDYDIEVFGVEFSRLKELLIKLYGVDQVDSVGSFFGVLKVKNLGIDVDISIPRKEIKTATGHRGFDVETDPNLPIEESLSRRDFTINSMAMDILDREIIDFWGGVRDLKLGILEITNSVSFGEDPLRALRAMQFIARFELAPSGKVIDLCAEQDLSTISKERIYTEFHKLLLKGIKVGNGLRFLRSTNLWKFFPEIKDLATTLQSPVWHAEGNVFTHTCMVLDQAMKFRNGNLEHDAVLMFSALCHDMGKPGTTIEKDGRIVSYDHENNLAPIESFLTGMRSPQWLIDKVLVMTKYHLTPFQFLLSNTGFKPYRRLSRALDKANIDPNHLIEVVLADQLGRIPSQSDISWAITFMANYEKAIKNDVGEKTTVPIVNGDDIMIALNIRPGPKVGELLKIALDLQDADYSKEEIMRSLLSRFQ